MTEQKERGIKELEQLKHLSVKIQEVSLNIVITKENEKAVANAPVPVTVNTNIKVPVDLKLQLKGRTGTLMFT